jgi:hypothetical protein
VLQINPPGGGEPNPEVSAAQISGASSMFGESFEPVPRAATDAQKMP